LFRFFFRYITCISDASVQHTTNHSTNVLFIQKDMSDEKIKNSKGTLQKVGSFLGVTEDDSQMRVWKDKCMERAQVPLQIFLISTIPFTADGYAIYGLILHILYL